MDIRIWYYQARLAEYVLALLASTSTPSEKDDFAQAKQIHERLVREFQTLDDESRKLVALRNEVDSLEQQVEDARSRLTPALFAGSAEIDLSAIERAAAALNTAADAADREKATLLARLLWPLTRKDRLQALAYTVRLSGPIVGRINIEVGDVAADDSLVGRVREIYAAIQDRVRDVQAVTRYRSALRSLQDARSLEDLARQQGDLQERMAKHSLQLWQLWLRLQPSRMPAAERQKLGKYAAVLRMVIEAGADGELSKAAWGEYRNLMREVAPLLPCWAVTSLSARGRIEFDPAIFDIVVFDEASQCDIASALPLLYRAKAVVVIGDAKQLSHISGLPRGQDQALMEKHGLFPGLSEWAYSHQSLFGLAATQVAAEDIVTLVDHHRSHADIINFSNAEFYEQRLRVATRYDRLKAPRRGNPGVTWIDIKGQAVRPASGGAINMLEVRAVVDTLRDLMLSKGYAGTVGVVTPFRAQANAVTEAVNADDALSSALIRAEFLADTVHRFQGDERDVMVFSPVVASDIADSALGFLRSNPNLFNVAITRARAQLIVVGDRTACMQSEVGYLSRFARYVASLGIVSEGDVEARVASMGPDFPSVAQPELVSEWERVLYRALFDAGIRPIPQYPVEKFILDFLVVSNDRRLAIEVDGERYHRNWTGELRRRDQLRNQRLFELGYDVRRFWVYEIRDDLQRCVAEVEHWLKNGT
jgi:very-short-patch-repair endonuclease